MIYIFIIIAGLILDRLSKIYAINNFIGNPIEGPIINLTYLENRGAAFGILQDRRIFFLLITVGIVCYLIYYFIKNYKNNPLILNVALSFIISGALGNFYDRAFNGYVVDFIEISFVNFPIFNIADIFVTIGCGLSIIYILFIHEEN
ncbi:MULTISPECIES: signal peptidase II [Anaerococcus]|uniref:Lipoprotein signal peptidase n=2 Tax=Anaerococcus TaxID=165779 RepID=A0ABW9MDY3_9FIRM|nr:signal peptidase II [Anaerococcus sp. Marseille-P3915]